MKNFLVFLTFCAVLTYSCATAARAVNPSCLVKASCASSSPPVFASTDGGRTCQRFGNVCFYKDEWCNNDYNGLPGKQFFCFI